MKKVDQINWIVVQNEFNEGSSVAELLQKYEFSYGLLRTAKKKGLFVNAKTRRSVSEVQSILDAISNEDPKTLLTLAHKYDYAISSIIKHYALAVTVKTLTYVRELLIKYGVDRSLIERGGSCSYTVEQLVEVVPRSKSYTEICRNLNITICSFNFDRIRDICIREQINCSHIKDVRLAHSTIKWTEENVFVDNCTIPRSSLRLVLKRLGFHRDNCELCGLFHIWNGKKLTLEIDHINGNCRDNRKTNLRWLCPNCHSQTDTYRRKRQT